ncbi:MAG: amidohydrolase family protein [Myxococcales bacterium]|nr:amidohydrolase family protein [Myxococcales bacterium]
MCVLLRKALLPAVLTLLLVACPARDGQGPHGSKLAKVPRGKTRRGVAALPLADWAPRSMLEVKRTPISKPSHPVVDVHTHLGHTADVAAAVKMMDKLGIETVVNLDGSWGKRLRENLARFDKKYPGRFLTYALIDFSGIDGADWGKKRAAQLAKDFEAGAKGLKIHKSLGLTIRYKDGRRLALDDAKLDPIWRTCARYKRPVEWHVADPAAFFTKLDRNNERWHELGEHPHWSFADRKRFPTRAQLFMERERVLKRHRETTFIGAHMGNWPENLAQVGRWLDAHPNFFVDIDARINELGRQPYTARRFLMRYQDRVLFGTDTGAITRPVYETYYRFLETDDEYFDTAPANGRQGFWMVYGLKLPKAVLRKLYRDNARRLLAFEPYKPPAGNK